MALSSSKKFILSIVLSGFALQVQAGLLDSFSNFQRPSNKTMAISGMVAFAITSAIISKKQEKQPAIETNNPFVKAWGWYLREFCGQAPKKSQKGYLTKTKAHMNEDGTIDFDTDLMIKDYYSEASGHVGKAIGWYDANEKDIKQAVGIGGIVALLAFRGDIKDIIGNFMKAAAPY